jgi:hypothetical protein
MASRIGLRDDYDNEQLTRKGPSSAPSTKPSEFAFALL